MVVSSAGAGWRISLREEETALYQHLEGELHSVDKGADHHVTSGESLFCGGHILPAFATYYRVLQCFITSLNSQLDIVRKVELGSVRVGELRKNVLEPLFSGLLSCTKGNCRLNTISRLAVALSLR